MMLTYRKEKELPLILQALYLQKKDVDNWELVIVDDGSDDNTLEVIDKYSADMNIRVSRLSHTGNRNYARNYGLKQCKGKRIVILDGDICPNRKFLFSHNEYGEKDILVIGERQRMMAPLDDGKTKTILNGSNIRAFETLDMLADDRIPYLMELPLEEQKHAWRFVHSHNMSIAKSTLIEVGYFDEDLSYWGADDLELGYRICLHGKRIVFDKNCGGVHLFHKSSHNPEYEKNLNKFYNKFKKPEIELLFIEWELNPVECNKAFNNCDIKDLTIDINCVESLSSFGFNKENTIADCVLVNGQKMFDLVDGIGIYIKNINKEYENVILSPYLIKMGECVFVRIIENLKNISKNIYIYDPDKKIEKQLKCIGNYNERHRFLYGNCFWKYEWENKTEKINLNFYLIPVQDLTYHNLIYESFSNEINKIENVQSMLARKFDLNYSSRNTNQKTLQKAIIPSRILFEKNEKVFIFPEYFSTDSKYHYKNVKTVFFNKFWYDNYHDIESNYDIIVFDSKKKVNKMKNEIQTDKIIDFIEPFYHPQYFYPVEKPRQEKYLLSVIQNNFFETIKLDDLLCYAHDLKDISIRVYFEELEWIRMNFPYMNSSWNLKVEKWANAYNTIRRGSYDVVKNQFKKLCQDGTVKFIQTEFTQKKLAKILQGSNGCICNEPQMIIQALACGTDVITMEKFNCYSFTSNPRCYMVPETIIYDYENGSKLKFLDATDDQKDLKFKEHYETDSVIECILSSYRHWRNYHAWGEYNIGKEHSINNATQKMITILKESFK